MLSVPVLVSVVFFFHDPPTTGIYTLSLHDALPICRRSSRSRVAWEGSRSPLGRPSSVSPVTLVRSEEHTSELQSLTNLVCRLLLEKKKRSHKTQLIHHATIYNAEEIKQRTTAHFDN